MVICTFDSIVFIVAVDVPFILCFQLGLVNGKQGGRTSLWLQELPAPWFLLISDELHFPQIDFFPSYSLAHDEMTYLQSITHLHHDLFLKIARVCGNRILFLMFRSKRTTLPPGKLLCLWVLAIQVCHELAGQCTSGGHAIPWISRIMQKPWCLTLSHED